MSPRKEEESRMDKSSKRIAHNSRRGEDVKKRSKRESPRKTSREDQGRRESTNSRRCTETQRKTSSSRRSMGYNKGRTRGKEVAVAKELPRGKPEDTDQEVEVTFEA